MNRLHRRPGVRSLNEGAEEDEQAGEHPQHRAKEALPEVPGTPPQGEGPSAYPASGMPYQNPGEGPATDD